MDVSATELMGNHAATLLHRPTAGAEIIQSVACCALDAAVKMALESAFSTFSHELMY